MASDTPKEPARRRRRNRAPGATTLTVLRSGQRKGPALPEHHYWRDETIAWWADVWASPMAPEYDDSDVHGLLLLAVLVDAFWTDPSKELAAEIRLQRQCFGLSPIDRRRLQWEIERGEEATQRTTARQRSAAPRAVPARKDPRKALAS